jgi:hypothetical protein
MASYDNAYLSELWDRGPLVILIMYLQIALQVMII